MMAGKIARRTVIHDVELPQSVKILIKMKKRIPSILLFVFTFLAAFGQPNRLYFHHLGVENGLSQTTNFFIYRDSKGFVWIQSANGVNRFDGRSVQQYLPDANDPEHSLFGLTPTSSFWEDEHSNLWFSTTVGINCYIRKHSHFRHYVLKDKAGQALRSYYVMALDKKNNLWVIVNHELYLFNIKTNSFTPHFDLKTREPHRLYPFFDSEGNPVYVLANSVNEAGLELIRYNQDGNAPLSSKLLFNDVSATPFRIVEMFIEAKDKVWLATTDGLYLFNPLTEDLKNYPLKKEIVTGNLTGVEPYQSDFLLITCNNGGLLVFDKRKGDIVQQYQHIGSDPSSLSENTTRSVYVDPTGVVWVAVPGKGIDYAYPEKLKFERHLHSSEFPELKKAFRTSCIAEDKAGNIWCGSSESGIAVLLRQERRWKFYEPNKKGLPLGHISKIFVDAKGRVWVLFWGKLLRYNPTKDIFDEFNSSTYFHAIQLQDGRTIFASRGEGVQQLIEDSRGLSLVKIDSIDASVNYTFLYETQDGLLLANANGNYLRIFDIRSNFKEIQAKTSVEGVINGFYERPDSRSILVATANGLYELNKQNWQTDTIYTEKEGLPSRMITGIMTDAQNRLWLSTTGGLALFDINKKQNRFHKFTLADGLSAIEHTMQAYLADSNGKMWFGATNGITAFRPDKFSLVKTQAVPQLTKMEVNNAPFLDLECLLTGASNPSQAKQLNFEYKNNTLAFEFAAMEYSDPAHTLFRYKMEGADKYWTNPSTDNTARYPDLRPGHYTFLVMASNSDGVWNRDQMIRLNIFIENPWWTTWWAITLWILLGAMTVALLIYVYFRPSLAVLEVREQMRTDLHDDIGSAINTIRSGSKLVLSKKEEERNLSDTVEEFFEISSDIYDKMHDLIWANDSKNNNISNILLRMRVDGKRILGENIRLELPNESALEAIQLSGEKRYHLHLIYKEALTNVAKYSEASSVKVNFAVQNNQLLMDIADDGKGFDSQEPVSDTSRGGNGLRNMKNRARKLHGKLTINSAIGKGTQIHLEFPMKRKRKFDLRGEVERIRQVIKLRQV